MDADEGEMEIQKEISDAQPAVEHTMKIKKKARVDDEDSSYSDENDGYVEQPHSHGYNEDLQLHEAKARKDLTDFLIKKGIDPAAADDYNIHVRLSKSKARRSDGTSGGPGFTVTYTGPDGSHLMSRSDVLSAIQDRSHRRHSHSSTRISLGTKVVVPRSQAIENAKSRYHQFIEEHELPTTINGIKIHNLGSIDTRSGFYSPVYLYPVGYRCEQTVSGTSFHKGLTSQKITCEIGETDGFPEFRIFVQSTGTTYIAPTETAVFKKVRHIALFSCLDVIEL